jgi:L-fuconate dehydratase
VDFTPEEFVRSTVRPDISLKRRSLWPATSLTFPIVRRQCFRYITDAITPDEALALLKAKEAGKAEREKSVIETGYPAYTTSVGWLGYDDEKVRRLTRESLAQGFNHFKLKVGANLEDDLRRGRIIREIIDDPKNLPAGREKIDPKTIKDKNAGPAGCVLMVDANQVWDVSQAVEYVKQLKPLNPWFIEEPTAPDDISGHAQIRKALKPHGIGVATGEHA